MTAFIPCDSGSCPLCVLLKQPPTVYVDIPVVDEDGVPIPGKVYRLKEATADRLGLLDLKGRVRGAVIDNQQPQPEEA